MFGVVPSSAPNIAVTELAAAVDVLSDRAVLAIQLRPPSLECSGVTVTVVLPAAVFSTINITASLSGAGNASV